MCETADGSFVFKHYHVILRSNIWRAPQIQIHAQGDTGMQPAPQASTVGDIMSKLHLLK